MRILPSSLRVFIALLSVAVVVSACAATPTLTVTYQPTEAEIAAQAEADRTFAATPAYLARVKTRASQVDSVRYEVFTEIDASGFSTGSRSEPVIIGEQTGNLSRLSMDMRALMGPMIGVAGFSPSAMSMTMISQGDVTYLNAPIFAEVISMTELSKSDFPWVDQVATGWGRIDAGASGSELMTGIGMNGGAGAQEMLALLDSVGDVLDGGTGEVRGVPVKIAHAEVSMVEVLQQSGQDLDEMGIGGDVGDALGGLSANIAVHIDDDGMVRRLEYTMDLSALGNLDPQMQNFDLRMWQRIDFYDYGTDIDIPIPVEFTDITDEFEDMLDELN